MKSDEFWMRKALACARLSAQRGEVPIGAVLIHENKLIASSHDGKELFHDPTAHAEILALRQGASAYGDWRLEGSVLYVTLEPCAMCAGAIVHSRVKRVVYGASNPRWGVESLELNILQNEKMNHSLDVVRGVLAEECAELLQQTFRRYRCQKSSKQGNSSKEG